MGTKLRSKQKGFTIIEVTIVLAIAAVIMVIVFTAVPALQRSSRNTERRNDASHYANLVNEYIANNNGTLPGSAVSKGTETFQQLTSNPVYYATAVAFNAAAPTITTPNLVASSTCGANNTTVIGGNANQMAVAYYVETSSGGTQLQCIPISG